MDDYSDIDYSSESDVDHGLAEEYEAAKLLAAEGNVVDAMDALKTIMDLDVEKSKWGFKACKRVVKHALQRVRSAEELPSFLEYYRKLFPFINSNGVGANDAEKALDSLWTRFCSGDVEFSAKHQYCLFTWRHLESRCSRITRMKWAARLSNYCVTDRDYADIDEGMAEELEQFIDRNSSLEDANECFMRSVFDALLLVAHLNFRRERHGQVRIQLEQLRDITGKTDVSGESRGALKELNARVFVATGQFGKASKLLRELLDEKAFLAAHPVRYPRACSQLRVLAPLVPSSAVFPGEDDDIVDRILRCYRTNDKAGLLAAMADVADGDDSSAVLEISNALVRNMTFPRMSADAWIDVFACLERYDIDSALLVGRRLSVLVADIAHRLPLRVITDVSLLGEISYDVLPQHVYEAQIARTAYPFACLDGQRLVKTSVFFTQMSADNGRTAKGL